MLRPDDMECDYQTKRALSAQSINERIVFEGKRVHVVGAACDVAALWPLLQEHPGHQGRYLYDPTEEYLVAWSVVREVLSATKTFLSDHIIHRSSTATAARHLFGVYAYQRWWCFKPEVDDAIFQRLTYYNGLPEHWTVWHSYHSYEWDFAHSCPVLTCGMWQRLLTGCEPEWDPSFLLPQNPIPLMEQFAALYQATKHLRVLPCTIAEANTYVKMFHRHNGPVQGALYALCAVDRLGNVHGVALMGRPVSRMLDAGVQGEMKRRIVEVTRVATDGTANVNSMLYASARRVAKAAGFERIVTYTLQSEQGTGLRADGWRVVAEVNGGQWACNARGRARKNIYDEPKYRWECQLNPPRDFELIRFPEDHSHKMLVK